MAINWNNTTIKLSSLKPWEHNPRTMSKAQAKRLIKSWDTLGQFQTIAIGPDGEVYDGHQRLNALLVAHGKDYAIEARQSDRALSDDERAALTLAANVPAGRWDADKLAAWDVSALQEWGMNADTLKDWQADVSMLTSMLEAENGANSDVDAEPQIDKAEELRDKWGVELGEHRLLCGDALKNRDVVLIGDNAAVVSDPPYGISVDTSWLSALNMKRGKPRNTSDDKLANDDGLLDLSWCYEFKEWLLFGFPFIARDENYTGLLVWDKRGDGGEHGLGNPVEVAASNAFNGYRLERHVWAGYVREQGEKREPHPTQKPIGIIEDAIKLVKNEIIFDPFSGSGTTIIACERLGRKCRAVEISPAYVAVALQRWADATGKTPVLIES